jgi:hypothetical protein
MSTASQEPIDVKTTETLPEIFLPVITYNTHKCDFCVNDFKCMNPSERICDCVQAVIQGPTSNKSDLFEATVKLVFYCSEECHDDDFTESDDNEDDDETNAPF